MLLYLTHILTITQLEVVLLQTTLTSRESHRNPRHKWEESAWLLREPPCLCRSRCRECVLPGKGGTKKSSHTKFSSGKQNPSLNNFSWAQTGRTGKHNCLGKTLLWKLLSCKKLGQKICEGLFGVDATPFLLSWTMVFIWLKNKEQNFETTPAATDNSSGVTWVAKENKTRHPGFYHFW